MTPRPVFARPRRSIPLLAILVALLVPATARAHGHLTRAVPAAGATLTTAPRQLRLEFSEAPELPVSMVRLLDSGGREIALSPLQLATSSRRTLVADITGPLAAGRYTVSWRTAGKDGHPVHGEYAFTIAVGAAGLAAPPAPVRIDTTPRETPPPPSAMPGQTGLDSGSVPYVLIRLAELAGLLLVIGAVAFRMLVLAAAERTVAGPAASAAMARSAARLGEWGALLLAVSAVLRLLMQSVVVRGAATVPSGVSLEGIIAGTTWGHGWLLQIAALVVVAIGFRLARGAASARAGWAIASIAAIVLAFTPGFGGHAAAAGPLAMTIDGMHVLAAGGWLGSLFVLLVAGIPAALALPADERNRVLAALVNAFSPTALLFAALLLGSGALAGWRNLGSIGALTHSRYGRVLLLKLGALALVALAGLYNWRRARPALGAGNDATRIRRTMRAELVAGAMVLLVTAVLVAIPTPADLAE